MTIQPKNNNLNYLIDPTFAMLIDYLFCHFKELLEKIIQQKIVDYYIPNVRMKDFNVLIDGKAFLDLPVKNEEEAYEKIIDMSNNNDYITSNLLHFEIYYFKRNYRLIAIDLSKQTKLKDPQ